MSPAPFVSVTEGGPLDLDAVMTVMEDSFDPAFGEAWTAVQCAGLLPMPGVWLLLASQGGAVVGFALARIILREAELLLLAVRKDHQRRGIGQSLVDGFLSTAATRGAAEFHLEVREGNPAVKLYNSFGFSEVGRRKKYYTGCDGQLYDAITLSKH